MTLANITAQGGTALSIEDILVADGSLDSSEIYNKWGLQSMAFNLYY